MDINKMTEQRKGVLALVFLTLVFASMGLFARYLSTGFLLFQQVYLRVLAALVLGYLIFRSHLDIKKLKKVSPKEWGLLVFRGAASYLFGVTMFTQAIIITKYSNVSFIGALPMTAIFGVLLFKEKLNYKKFLLILLAFIGVLLIAVKDYSNITVWGKGEFITLISTVFFAISYVARKWHSNLLNNKEITVLTFFFAFILLFATSLIKGDGLPPASHWTIGLFVAVIGGGLFNVFNVFLTNYGFQKVEAILASNILTLESVFAVFLGFIFFREVPSLRELIGGLIIVTSVIGMNQLEEKEAK